MLLDGHSAQSVCQRLGISCPMILRSWKRQQLKQSGPVANSLDTRIRELEIELRRVQRERDILKKSFNHFRPQRLAQLDPAAMSICRKKIASEREVCEVLDLNRSSFQTWQLFQESEGDRNDAALQSKIVPIFHRHRGRYGSRRVLAELKDMDTFTSRRRITKLLKNVGLRPIQAKSFKPRTTESRHSLGYNENLLLGMPEPAAINQLWVADITYIPILETGFCYLAMVMDRYSRRIIGWELKNDMTEQLTINALRQAIKTTQPLETLIHHRDRGGPRRREALSTSPPALCK